MCFKLLGFLVMNEGNYGVVVWSNVLVIFFFNKFIREFVENVLDSYVKCGCGCFGVVEFYIGRVFFG